MNHYIIPCLLSACLLVSCDPKTPKKPKTQLYHVHAYIERPGIDKEIQYRTTDPAGGFVVTPVEGMPDRWSYKFPDGSTCVGGKMSVDIIKWN